MDKKLLYMGIAGLILLILMLIGGCVCAVYIIRAMRPHTNEIDVSQSSRHIEFLAMRTSRE